MNVRRCAAYLVVAEAAVGRQIPFLLLERIKDDFKATYGFRARTAIALAFDRQYAPKLKQFMNEAMSASADPDKMRSVQNQVSAVKSVMIENIERVLDRGEKIELLVDKTETLRFQADTFQKSGRQLRRAMCRQNLKMKLVVVGILIMIGLVLFFVLCYGGGRNCTSSGKSSPPPSPSPSPPLSPSPVSPPPSPEDNRFRFALL